MLVFLFQCQQIHQGPIYQEIIAVDPDDLAQLSQFVGYGPCDAPLVFLGIEEKGRDPADHPGDIEARVEHYAVPVMDLRDAHELLHEHQHYPAPNPFDAPPGARPVQQWTTAACFALELLAPLHMADPAMGPDEYWRDHLGRTHGQTLLAECYPVPRPNMGVAIEAYDPRYVWIQQRLPILANFFLGHAPLFVVAYGVPTWELVGDVFGQAVGNCIPVNALVMGGPRIAGNVYMTQTGVVVCRTRFFGRGAFNRQCIPFLAAQMHALMPG